MIADPAQENEKTSDRNAAEVANTPTNAQLLRTLVLLKLKLAGGYILDGFAPVVAVIALIVAVMAINGNKSGQAELAQNTAKIASLSESLLASKAEVEKLKIALAQEKLSKEEQRNKQDEQTTKIIQGVSKLQVKMKVSPTLEEQFHQPVAALIATPPVVTATPATLAPVNPASPAAKPASLPATAGTAPAATPASKASDKKPGGQKEILKEAIDKFNKK